MAAVPFPPGSSLASEDIIWEVQGYVTDNADAVIPIGAEDGWTTTVHALKGNLPSHFMLEIRTQRMSTAVEVYLSEIAAVPVDAVRADGKIISLPELRRKWKCE